METAYQALEHNYEDENQRLEIFPEEVWRQIFHHIQNAETVQRASSSCKYFKDCLKPLRTCLLFPSVLLLLMSYLKPKNPFAKERGEVLKIRQVCCAWRTGADTILQRYSESFMHHWKKEDGFKWHPSLHCTSAVKKFYMHFKDTHFAHNANPFLGRGLHLTQHYILPDRVEDYVNNCINVLRNCGHHIWYCHLHLMEDRKKGGKEQCYQWAKEVLKLLPNIKVLWIAGKYFGNPSNTDMEQYDNYVKLNPLPKLKNLQILNMELLMHSVAAELLEKNNQISSLELNLRENLHISRYELPNLSQLNIIYNEYNDVVPRETVIRQLDTWRASSVNWALTHLCMPYFLQMPLHSLLETIESRFGTTLKVLELCLSILKTETNVPPLCLPHLVVLKVLYTNCATLDYILPMQNNLRELSVEIVDIRDTYDAILDQANTIRIFSIKDQLYASNIWDLFPKLVKIEIKSNEEERRRWLPMPYGHETFRRTCNRDKWRKYKNISAN